MDHAVEGQCELVGGGLRRGKLLGAGNGILKNEVHALAGALHHSAALEDLGKTAIPGCLTVEQRFEKANTTHDGKLTKAQATAAKWTSVSRNFASIDKDKKGFVTVDDIKAAAAKKPAPKKVAAPVAPAVAKP